MNGLSIPVLVIAGVTCYVGLYHLLIYLRRRKHPEDAAFALMCFAFTAYDLFCAGLYNATSIARGPYWQRGQIVSLALAGTAFLWFIAFYTSKTFRRVDVVFSALYLALAALVAVLHSEATWLDQPAIKRIDLFFGTTITYYEMTPGPLVSILNLMGVLLFSYSLWAAIRLYRSGERKRARPLIVALLCFFAGLFNDVAVSQGVYAFFYVLEYAYLAIVLLMTYALTVQVIESSLLEQTLRESEEKYRRVVKSADEELVRARALLQAAIEQSPSGIIVADAPDVTIRLANPAATGIRGQSQAFLTGIDVSLHTQRWQTFHLDGRPYAPEDLPLSRAILKGEVTKNEEVIIRNEDGEDCWVLANATPVRDRDGAIVAGIVVFHDIAEHKRIETALRRERDLVARIMETSPVSITMVDRQGRITFANRRAQSVLGLEKDVFTQRTYNAPEWRITDYDGAPFPQEQLPFVQVMHTGRSVEDVRHAVEWPDGRRVLLSINAAPLFDAAGQFDGVVATFEDVTHQRQAERALRESERKSRNIIESIPMGMHIYDLMPDGRLVFAGANPAADEILGVDNSQFVGKTIEEAFPALTYTEVPEQYRRVASSGEMWKTDQVTYEEGSIAGAFEVHAFCVSPQRMVAAFMDVTEQRRAQEQIRRLQHLLQNITDSMPSGLITVDRAGRVLTWNPAAVHMTGLSTDAARGQMLWVACPALAGFEPVFDQVVRERQVVHQHRVALAAVGAPAVCDVSFFPLVENDVQGAVLRIDDVTRRVQMEEMMFQSAKMASVGGLAAGVAHEINNPLGAMMQSAQVLQIALDPQRPRTRQRLRTSGVDPDGLQRYLEARGLVNYLVGIRETGARAAKIVSDLLSFSRRSSSKVAPHDVNALVRQALELAATDYDLKKRYDFRNVEIVWELTPGLQRVVCDGQQIQQVILNLVQNAAHAIEERNRRERVQGRLTLRSRLEGEMVRLEVEDNGAGIPQAMRPRLFEPFFTAKEVGEGTGLGLWLCWSIVVERHHGQIWFEDGADGGARCVIQLPAM
ncbi:MAG: PAS domain S-box protein [Anaerolineae bacterium]|nr:PAS domain S-box protein [Anaerolineae bacterium]